jgi:hypothetical protein
MIGVDVGRGAHAERGGIADQALSGALLHMQRAGLGVVYALAIEGLVLSHGLAVKNVSLRETQAGILAVRGLFVNAPQAENRHATCNKVTTQL